MATGLLTLLRHGLREEGNADKSGDALPVGEAGRGSAYKPRSVQPTGKPHGRGDHLSWPDVAAGLEQPTRSSRGTSRTPAFRPHSCLALLPVGVAWPPALLPAPVVSYTTFSPSPRTRYSVPGAVLFCGPLRGSPRPGVTRHRALWSADFPQATLVVCDRPADPSP